MDLDSGGLGIEDQGPKPWSVQEMGDEAGSSSTSALKTSAVSDRIANWRKIMISDWSSGVEKYLSTMRNGKSIMDGDPRNDGWCADVKGRPKYKPCDPTIPANVQFVVTGFTRWQDQTSIFFARHMLLPLSEVLFITGACTGCREVPKSTFLAFANMQERFVKSRVLQPLVDTLLRGIPVKVANIKRIKTSEPAVLDVTTGKYSRNGIELKRKPKTSSSGLADIATRNPKKNDPSRLCLACGLKDFSVVQSDSPAKDILHSVHSGGSEDNKAWTMIGLLCKRLCGKCSQCFVYAFTLDTSQLGDDILDDSPPKYEYFENFLDKVINFEDGRKRLALQGLLNRGTSMDSSTRSTGALYIGGGVQLGIYKKLGDSLQELWDLYDYSSKMRPDGTRDVDYCKPITKEEEHDWVLTTQMSPWSDEWCEQLYTSADVSERSNLINICERVKASGSKFLVEPKLSVNTEGKREREADEHEKSVQECERQKSEYEQKQQSAGDEAEKGEKNELYSLLYDYNDSLDLNTSVDVFGQRSD